MFDNNISAEYMYEDLPLDGYFTLFCGEQSQERFDLFVFFANKLIETLQRPADVSKLFHTVNDEYFQTAVETFPGGQKISAGAEILFTVKCLRSGAVTSLYLGPPFGLKSRLFYFLFSKPVAAGELRFHFKSHPLLRAAEIRKVNILITENFQRPGGVFNGDLLRFAAGFPAGILKTLNFRADNPAQIQSGIAKALETARQEADKFRAAYEAERIRAKAAESGNLQRILELQRENDSLKEIIATFQT